MRNRIGTSTSLEIAAFSGKSGREENKIGTLGESRCHWRSLHPVNSHWNVIAILEPQRSPTTFEGERGRWRNRYAAQRKPKKDREVFVETGGRNNGGDYLQTVALINNDFRLMG